MCAARQSKTPEIFRKPKFLRKPTAARKFTPAKAQVLPNQEILPEIIQGKRAGSKLEARVSVALDHLQYKYMYQVTALFGRSRRGGQVLDFVITDFKPYIVLDVRGAYWHTGIHEDVLFLERAVRAKKWKLAVIWDYEATTVDQAISTLRGRLPHG